MKLLAIRVLAIALPIFILYLAASDVLRQSQRVDAAKNTFTAECLEEGNSKTLCNFLLGEDAWIAVFDRTYQ